MMRHPLVLVHMYMVLVLCTYNMGICFCLQLRTLQNTDKTYIL